MLIPFLILGILSVIAGFLGLNHLLHQPHEEIVHANAFIMILSLSFGFGGLGFSFMLYGPRAGWREKIQTAFSGMNQVLVRKYYMDDLYDFMIQKIQQPWAMLINAFEENVIIQTWVNGSVRISIALGHFLRRMQTGQVQTYIAVFFTGVIILIYFSLVRSLP